MRLQQAVHRKHLDNLNTYLRRDRLPNSCIHQLPTLSQVLRILLPGPVALSLNRGQDLKRLAHHRHSNHRPQRDKRQCSLYKPPSLLMLLRVRRHRTPRIRILLSNMRSLTSRLPDPRRLRTNRLSLYHNSQPGQVSPLLIHMTSSQGCLTCRMRVTRVITRPSIRALARRTSC